MAPSTPPPPSNVELAALTIASTASVVMSTWTAASSVIGFRSRGGAWRLQKAVVSKPAPPFGGLSRKLHRDYDNGMASTPPVIAPGSSQPAPPPGGQGRPAKPPDRRLRVDDILKLMVSDGL